jgi:hypothetical protein
VALVVAGVVVANPIIAPRADVQIPAVKLSAGNDETGGMLDQAFLDAIAPLPSESDNPFSVLKQLITSLAVDATSVGKNAIVDAFVAGVAAVSQPELTASAVPYVGPPFDLPVLTEPPVTGWDLSSLAPAVPTASAMLSQTTSLVTEAVTPVIQDLVTSLVADAGYVGGGLVAAAFAAGTLVASEPRLIANTLVAIVRGDLNGALENAVKAVAAPLAPPSIILGAVQSIIESHLAQLSGMIAALTTAPLTDGSPAIMPKGDGSTPATKLSDRENRGNLGEAPMVPVPSAALVRRPASRVSIVGVRANTGGIPEAAASRDVNFPGVNSDSVIGAARDAVQAISDQAGAAVAGVADTVGKIATHARAGRVAATGDGR